MIDRPPPPRRVFLSALSRLDPAALNVCQVLGKDFAVTRLGTEWIAFENACPHQGVPFSERDENSGQVVCPSHRWTFDLASGERVGVPQISLKKFVVVEEDGTLFIELPTPSAARSEQPTYLVRYALPGWVASFRADQPLSWPHRSSIVVRTNRGEEIGEFLGAAPRQREPSEPVGAIVRLLDPQEESRLHSTQPQLDRILDAIQAGASARNLPQEFPDAEQLLSGEVIVYYLGPDGLELADLAADLRVQQQCDIRFQPLFDPPPQKSCGSGGCGCGK